MTLLIIFGHFLKIRVLEIRLRHIFLILANYFVNFPNFHQEKDKCDFIFHINRYKIYVPQNKLTYQQNKLTYQHQTVFFINDFCKI